jgi:putative (di)nucleoside polyphosphate hydrolase
MPPKFRPCVAALLQNPEGKILIAERRDFADSWQFPQGGIDAGESPRVALIREMGEELSLKEADFEILTERPGYRYEFPKKHRRWGKYIGQEQTYFLCRFTANDSAVNIDTPHPEFRSWKWIRPDEFKLPWLPEFKRQVYHQVMLDFFKIDLALE